MIKLENPTNAPQAFTLLTLQSLSDIPTVSLSLAVNEKNQVKIPSKRVGENWVEEPDKRIQVVSVVNDSGEAISVEGVVKEIEAVEITGAFKVVVAVRVTQGLKGAYDRGAVSKAYAGIELLRVVEVWATSAKRLYSSGELPKGGKTMGADGKIAA